MPSWVLAQAAISVRTETAREPKTRLGHVVRIAVTPRRRGGDLTRLLRALLTTDFGLASVADRMARARLSEMPTPERDPNPGLNR